MARIWFITGASTGFGRVLTQIVLDKGDIAVATARRPSVLSDLAEKYPSERLLVLKLDVSQTEDIREAFAAVQRQLGRIDVVVNNAAFGVVGESEGMRDEDVRPMFESNFWGMANVSREAVRFFREVNPAGAGGRLLQFSSIAGVGGIPGLAYYSASKSALEGFNEGFAAELDPTWNIKITIVQLGGFETGGVHKTPVVPVHPAYTKAELPTVTLRSIWPKFPTEGDPKKGMEAIYRLSSLHDPPLHFPLGKDAIATLKRKATVYMGAAENYESWSDNVLKDDEQTRL